MRLSPDDEELLKGIRLRLKNRLAKRRFNINSELVLPDRPLKRVKNISALEDLAQLLQIVDRSK